MISVFHRLKYPPLPSIHMQYPFNVKRTMACMVHDRFVTPNTCKYHGTVVFLSSYHHILYFFKQPISLYKDAVLSTCKTCLSNRSKAIKMLRNSDLHTFIIIRCIVRCGTTNTLVTGITNLCSGRKSVQMLSSKKNYSPGHKC